MARHGGQQTETPKAADGVRGCVSNHAVHGQDDEAVRHASDMALAHHRILVGELASRNHLVQMLAGVDAFRLISAVGFSCGHIGLTHDQAQGLAIVPNRRVHVADGRLAHGSQYRGAEHHAGEHGGVNSPTMSSGMTFPTTSSARSVITVDGRHCSATTYLPSPSCTSSSRSAKLKSAITCQSATR